MPVALSLTMSTTANPEAWTRLEILVSAMRPGEVITVEEAVVQTGIAMESAAIVLDALVGAALFERHGHHFVRLSLFDHAELQRVFGSHLPPRQGRDEQEQSASPRRRQRARPRRPFGP
jgi:hypothetical protein